MKMVVDDYRPITSERKKEICHLLARSNKLAKKLSDKLLGKKKYPVFRAFFRGEPTNLSPADKRLLKSIKAADKKIIAMGDNVDLRNELVAGYFNLLRELSIKYSKRYNYLSDTDLFNQAVLELFTAMNGYTNSKISFITYLHCVVQNNLKRYCVNNRDDKLTSPSSNFITVLRLVFNAKEQLQKQGQSPDFYSIYEIVRPKCPKIKDVKGILQGILCQRHSLYHRHKSSNDFISDDTFGYSDNELEVAQSSTYDELMIDYQFNSYEQRVAELRLQELSWKEIAKKLKIDPKKLNKIQRSMKEKIKKQLAA